MHRLVFLLCILILPSVICAETIWDGPGDEEDNGLDSEDIASLSTTTPVVHFDIEDSDENDRTTTTVITPEVIEQVEDEIVSNDTESLSTATTTIPIMNDKPVKTFLTEYPLNVNLSTNSLSTLTFNTHFNDFILLVFEEHEIFLINKNDGTVKNYFQYASIIPVKGSNSLAIFDDNSNNHELWIINPTDQHNSVIPFKPKQIFVFSSTTNNIWLAETSDEVSLYISENSGGDWKKVDDSGSSTVLGWSDKDNSVVIVQHARHVKLLDVKTLRITSVLNDVASAKLFSRYLFTKRSNANESITLGQVNNLANEEFRSLPKRFQSQGTFYCAVEDINTQDLLLLFLTEEKLTDNNETTPSTCNLISHSKQNPFNLSNLDCASIRNSAPSNTIECSTERLPFYQVRGLPQSVFLANVASGPTTVVSFDGGVTWNRTHYECDKMTNCLNNVSIVISSLTSSKDAPGILIGKASDGANEYVAISSNGGRLWRLSSKGNNYLTAISNPDALVVTVSNSTQQSSNHSFRYSTDYGRHWHQGAFSNETSVQISSLSADANKVFYVLTLNNERELNLLQLDFNLLITAQCARHQLKEWSLPSPCINGSKSYYKQRIAGSYCLNNASDVRTEPCACSLSDFECLPGYRRSKEGICLPRSHYAFSQDCTCNGNSTLLSKRRGYVKVGNSQCTNGIENYLSDAYITRRDPNHPNFFLYGIDARTKSATIEIHTNDFDQNDDEEDEEEEEEDVSQNTVWSIDQTYEITAVTFDETVKQTYMAVEHDQVATIYRIGKNLRQQNRSAKQLPLDSNNELYKSTDERIEYLTVDWLAQNLYVLVRNKKSLQQNVFILDVRTRKRRTILQNQRLQPSILIVDPAKTNLYWISHQSPSTFNIGNLQGELKKQIRLLPTDSNIGYVSYDPITQEILFVSESKIYGLNTLDHQNLSPRLIYEHSANIQNALFVHPILYFSNENNGTDSSSIQLHAIDVLAKSFAKNIARFRHLSSLKLFVDMAISMPTNPETTINRCASNPCTDICIPLEHGRFRCLCNDNASFPWCTCPTGERFIADSCQAQNGQCAPGRVLCQNRIHCAESARVCEQDHTQYTPAFKDTARCTLDKPNDGFDCFYADLNSNNTCIPFEWLCDGHHDCPLGNDEEHCHKMTTTTTRKPGSKTSHRCLTEKKFTHVMCQHKCLKISDVCQNIANRLLCPDQFLLNCQRTNDKNQYVCKCSDDSGRCLTMSEHCDTPEDCERVCNDSIHFANAKSDQWNKPSSKAWLILIIVILVLLVLIILFMTVRYIRRRKNATKTPVPSRTPVEAPSTTSTSMPSDARVKLLNNGSEPVATETTN